MELYLGGYLSWYVHQKPSRLHIHLDRPVSLMELAARLELPLGEIAIAAVNGVAVSLHDAQITNIDSVEFHPPIGGV